MYATHPLAQLMFQSHAHVYRGSSIRGYRGNARLRAASVEGATGTPGDDVRRAQYLIVQLENRIRPLQADCSVINVVGKKSMRLRGPETCKLKEKKI